MSVFPPYLVALGANLPSEYGPPAETLRAALQFMHNEPAVSICSISQFWVTPAYPAGSGPDFINAAAIARSTLQPQGFLDLLHRIEGRFGRRRQGARWQARPLDLDLIGAGDLVLPDAATQAEWRGLPPDQQALRAPDGLILPHPRMQDRGFVLAPLAQIAPGWRHPLSGRSVAQMLADLPAGALDEMAPLPPLPAAPAEQRL